MPAYKASYKNDEAIVYAVADPIILLVDDEEASLSLLSFEGRRKSQCYVSRSNWPGWFVVAVVHSALLRR